jgi:hypothetical protein
MNILKLFRRSGRSEWKRDTLSFRPLHDRSGRLTVASSADGPIATLARIEMNAEDGLRSVTVFPRMP